MGENKLYEAKDKVVGGVKEATGKVFGSEELELKGKVQRGVGKAREVAGDVAHEAEDVKDKVVGTLKETTGKYTDDKGLQLRGKLQKGKVRNKKTNKIIFGVGAVAGLYLLAKIIQKSNERMQDN